MANTYRLGDPIPLFYVKRRNGQPVTGLSVTVTVLDAGTGATLLASTALSEVSPGQYSFVWNPNFPTAQDCVEIYTTGGKQFVSSFSILPIGQIVGLDKLTADVQELESVVRAAVFNQIQAVIRDDTIQATLNDSTITAQIADDTLQNTVQDNNLSLLIGGNPDNVTGIFEDNTTVGVASC